MYVFGAHDEMARRIFAFQEDRAWFGLDKEELKEESGEENFELDAEMLEEIKYKRLKAMLDGSETWHKDKF